MLKNKGTCELAIHFNNSEHEISQINFIIIEQIKSFENSLHLYIDRLNKAGGGVCVFASDRFKIERLDDQSSISPSGLHQLWLKVQVRNCKSFIICTVYRPPTTSLNCFDEELSGTIISALSVNKDIYILGDLNCNVLNPNDAASQTLINFCTAFNLTQMVKQPTRITETSATLIDVILASNTDLVKDVKVLPCSISDHDIV